MQSPEKLSLTDVVEAEDRVAFGGELVASHVRYVLGFDRAATDAEVEVIRDLLSSVEVVRSVSASGIEVITADRETPEKPVDDIRTTVAKATDEARRRALEAQEKQTAAAARSADLTSALKTKLLGDA